MKGWKKNLLEIEREGDLLKNNNLLKKLRKKCTIMQNPEKK